MVQGCTEFCYILYVQLPPANVHCAAVTMKRLKSALMLSRLQDLQYSTANELSCKPLLSCLLCASFCSKCNFKSYYQFHYFTRNESCLNEGHFHQQSPS